MASRKDDNAGFQDTSSGSPVQYLVIYVNCFPIKKFTVLLSTYVSVLTYFSRHKPLHKCPLTVSEVYVLRLREESVL